MASPTPTRAIAFLAFAAFASQAMVRSADPLLPQIAADLGTSIGAASVITSGYAVAHGLTQLVGTSLGDRFPKYTLVIVLCLLCAIATAACGMAGSLASLGIARLACGIAAGTIIPLAMAFVGDAVPYERRQPVLGRFLAGQIMGLVGGQIVGGVAGDYLGWRMVFFLLAGLFVFAACALSLEYLRNPAVRVPPRGSSEKTSILADYAAVFATPWARFIIFIAFLEFGLMFAAFAYIGADLHLRADLSFSAVGAVLGAFGIGGLIFVIAVPTLVARLGQIGLVIAGGALLTAAMLSLALFPLWWIAAPAIAAAGLGFYMVHNTLQVNATQIAPTARATALGVFSSSLYLGQSAGVAAVAPIVDRFGAAPVFIGAAIAWPLFCWWFAAALRRRRNEV